MPPSNGSPNLSRGVRITLIVFAVLMIVFGLAEVATGFRHRFFMISTQLGTLSTAGGALVGALYAASGVFLLPLRRWGAIVSTVCLAAVVIGRATLVLTGVFPLGAFSQIFSIIVGTAIACFFAVYVGLRVKLLR